MNDCVEGKLRNSSRDFGHFHGWMMASYCKHPVIPEP